MKEIKFLITSDGKCPFKKWLDSLKDRVVIYKIQRRMEQIQNGNYGDYKNLGGGLSELRFNNGIRIYYSEAGHIIVLLINGGDKASQKKDIEKARRLLEEIKEV